MALTKIKGEGIDGGTISTKTAGTGNLILGSTAGDSIASGGNYNTCVGELAGTAITSGTDNTLIGSNAGDALIDSDHNVAVGHQALTADTKGSKSTAVGAFSLNTQNFSSATDGYNTAIGYVTGGAVTTGIQNTLVGALAGDALTVGSTNVAIGVSALGADTQGDSSVAIGSSALRLQNITSSANAYNVAIGRTAGENVTTGTMNTFVGSLSGQSGTLTGDSNTAIGYGSLYAVQGSATRNTGLGRGAGQTITTGDNNIAIGDDALRSGRPGGEVTTGDNVIGLGNADHTASHIQVDWTVASDERDKTDFKALDIGLDFVKALAPVTYKWDKRSKYGDRDAKDYDISKQTPDGTYKEDWLDVGFKAQEVEKLEKAAGYKIADKTNLLASLSDDGKQYGMQYSKFVPVLTKAIQELSTALDAAVARIKKLEDG